ncbi:hypothetical protein COCSUDRAFT_60578 [Coccomyxa subellipsoidea C-169]|uniref:CCHC-type domain-containing protein n=1 Tax=Coccomyxa subellipsoidea (strain C-169) TaxID=574566 RepID=I0YI64_COCSC|nr:hypothetical protein COCSUDRAFT_60578 [Coccomyxa subellipsoidea C-169]EIE18083.1 hypothetical protein COCSUDRAFT_60578 [Coccomyxa subellipsoidea C-169]|eukprot:XP_005642627.1 hypothetical protein COCSUDRAFT_60578 [Coccomyxa subellipsoidea C-169]
MADSGDDEHMEVDPVAAAAEVEVPPLGGPAVVPAGAAAGAVPAGGAAAQPAGGAAAAAAPADPAEVDVYVAALDKIGANVQEESRLTREVLTEALAALAAIRQGNRGGVRGSGNGQGHGKGKKGGWNKKQGKKNGNGNNGNGNGGGAGKAPGINKAGAGVKKPDFDCTCYNCDQKGHKSYQCPHPKKAKKARAEPSPASSLLLLTAIMSTIFSLSPLEN